jgi:transposase-like protein
MSKNQGKVGQNKSELVGRIPHVCMEEAAAVEMFESMRWGDKPFCVHCGSTNVYKMTSANGERNKRFLWRCHECKKQYTVRIGTVYEESRIPLKYWAYAFWRSCSSKKGVAALEIKRQTGLSYTSALFMMHRIRMAMTDENPPKLTGTIEADEVFLGGRPRKLSGRKSKRGRGAKKTPVVALVQRDGEVRTRIVSRVSGSNLRRVIKELVDTNNATLMTDEWASYRVVGREFKGGHETVNHGTMEYSRGDAHVNTAESFFAIIRRGLHGIYHSVSKQHLHRYLNEFAFRFNGRKLDDGERTAMAIRGAEGKRLYYKAPAA